jgi:hypothetical protein
MPMQTYVDSNGVEVQAAKIIHVTKPPGVAHDCIMVVSVRIEGGDDYVIDGDAFATTFDLTKLEYMLIYNDMKYSVLTVNNFNDAFTLKSSIGNAADFGVIVKPNVTYVKSGSSIEELGASDSAISAPKLAALPTAEAEVNEDLVKMLEDALECAKSGEFTGLAYAATDRQGNSYSAFILNQPVVIIGEMRVLERDIIDHSVDLRADDT